jgi:hypothetical protein
MAIKVFLGNTYAEVTSPAEAVELAKLWGNGSHPPQMQLPLEEPDAMKRLIGDLSDRSRKLLCTLVNFPDGTDGSRIAEVSGESSDAFGGLLGSVSKKAESLKLEPDSIFLSEMRNSGLKRYRFLAPGKLLLKYSDELLKLAELPWKEEIRRHLEKLEMAKQTGS